MKKSFQLSAIAIAVSLSASTFAADISADPTIEASDDINIHVDGGNNGNGGYGSLNVYKGQAGQPNTELLVHIDNNVSGGTTINTNTTITGNLAVNGGTSTLNTNTTINGNATINGNVAVNNTVNSAPIPGTSSTDNPFQIQFQGAVTIDPADSDAVILGKAFGANPVPAGAMVVHNVDGTKNITYQVANNTIQTDSSNVNSTSQTFNDQKVELSNGVVTTKTQSDFSGQTVTLKYAPTAPGSNNFVGSNPTPVVPVVSALPPTTLSEDSITVGKKVAGAVNALTVTDKDVTTNVTNEAVVNATGLTVTNTTAGVTKSTTVGAESITTGRINGNGAGGALVLHGGTTSTTQTLDDSGVLFVTTDTFGTETGRTSIDAYGNLVVKGRDVLVDIDAEATARAAADTAEATARAAADTTLQDNIDAEAATRAAADTAEATARAAADTTLQNNINVEAATRAAADTTLQSNINAEAAARQAGDTAIRNDIATKVTTNALEVNGPSTFNGPVTVNGTVTATTVATSNLDLGTNSNTVTTNTAPSANRLTARYDTTDANGGALTVYETQSGGVSTYYTITNGVATEFTTASVINTLGTTVSPVAGGTTNTQSVLNTTTATIKQVTSTAVTYGEVKTQQDAVTVSGTLNNGQAIAVNVGTGAPVEVNNQSVVSGIIGQDANGNNIYGTVATAKTTNASGQVTSNSSTTLTASGVTTTGSVTANSVIVAGKNVTNEFTRVDAAAAAETVRVNTALTTETNARIAGDTATLVSANAYTDTRASQLNRRVDEVEKTSYRGIAIALAAQQQVPNIKPGQFAVFGGVGHYEGESAVALGVVGALNDRTSFSAALGLADSEIGGRVGVAYVFGGN